MKKYVIFAVLLSLLLCGCGKGNEVDPDAVNFAECPTIAIEEVVELPNLSVNPNGTNVAGDISAAENGIFALKRDENYEDAFLQFTDFVSGETYPICVRPNCVHNDYLCSAYLKNASNLHFDGTHLYWFSGNECQFWRMNIDGTDRKMLFACNEKADLGQLMHIGNACYLRGKVYFTTFGSIMNSETHEIEIGEHICVGDLESGTYAFLPITFQGNKSSSTLSLRGMYGDLMFFEHTMMLQGIYTPVSGLWKQTGMGMK